MTVPSPVAIHDRLQVARTLPERTAPIRVAFVMHWMRVAGAEMLVDRMIRDFGPRIVPTVICLDEIGPLGEQLRRDGVEVVCVERRPGRDLRAAWRIARLIRSREIEIIHAHQYTPFFYSALARLLGGWRARLIFTEHGRHFPDHVSPLRRFANRHVFSRFPDRINAVCQFSANALREIDGFGRQSIEVIYNGVDPTAFRPATDRPALRRELGLSADRKYVVTVARFHPIKDHRTLLEAFARVAQRLPNVDLVLVGDGPLRVDLETQARELGLAERVQFWGVRRDVARILQAADLFVLPSISEAASLTLLEAMSCGCPVVVTDVGGNPEIVREGVDGLRVPRGNSAAMAAAIERLASDPAQCEAFGASARQRVCEVFDQSAAIGQFLHLFEELAPVGRRAVGS